MTARTYGARFIVITYCGQEAILGCYYQEHEEKKDVGCRSASVHARSVARGADIYRPGDSYPLPIVEVDGKWQDDWSKMRPATKEDFEFFNVVPPAGLFD